MIYFTLWVQHYTYPEKFCAAPLSMVEATFPAAEMGQNFSGER